jgi:Baseplate J-like protein
MSDTAPLDTCGACQGVTALTPASVANPPGLPALSWRVGTQASFKQSLLASLSANPSLRALTTRADNDPSVALLDAWAVALDVLTFYQERIANENYLRTATQQRSVLEMARAIGYELRPGVSASTPLAFTLETQTIPGALPIATLPAGAKVQSIPGQNEQSQTFETAADLDARAAWNSIAARTRGSSTPYLNQAVIYLQGASTGLLPGDPILIVGDERVASPGNENWDFRRVQAVATNATADPTQSWTAVTLDRPLGQPASHVGPAKGNPRVFGMRRRAALFGANAPDPRMLNSATLGNFSGSTDGGWANFNIGYSSYPSNPAAFDTIYLDSPQPAAVQGSWVVLVAGGYEEVYQITKAEEAAQTQFGLAGKSTKLTLSGENLAAVYWDALRETSVFIQTDELRLAAVPLTDSIAAGTSQVDLAVLLSGDDVPTAGRPLILTDGTQTEAVTLKAATTSADGVATLLIFNETLQNTYARSALQVLANVVDSSNGETRYQPAAVSPPPVSEYLGNGDGTAVFQKFQLKQVPLTYVSAATASGGTSTLQIRVNDVLWTEVPSFYGHGPNEQIFITRRGDTGVVTVEFGDGVTGARLPTGNENVSALYRVGSGLAGNVRAGQLSLLVTRPLGVKGVTNPLAASGGDDGDQLADARQNAPLTVLTLDRVVSLIDCEDFARAFSGIGKAAAAFVWDGQYQIVHLTIASAAGGAVDPASDTFTNLVAAIDAARHPIWPIVVQTFTARPFVLEASVAIDPAYDSDEVSAKLNAALSATFSFAARDFGQAVTSSDIYQASQAVAGVVGVDITKLYFADEAPQLRERLAARTAWLDSAGLNPAELLTLDPTAITLDTMPS